MPKIFVFIAGDRSATQHLADSIANPIPDASVLANFAEAHHEELERVGEAIDHHALHFYLSTGGSDTHFLCPLTLPVSEKTFLLGNRVNSGSRLPSALHNRSPSKNVSDSCQPTRPCNGRVL